ncbi:hypothetical protein NFI96_003652, partial [Prochilodus magdalenae]
LTTMVTLTFDQAWYSYTPYQFPWLVVDETSLPHSGQTLIIVEEWWLFSYQQYTTGNVLTQATEDINQYYPSAAVHVQQWVFIATWDKVAYYYYSVTVRESPLMLVAMAAVTTTVFEGKNENRGSTHVSWTRLVRIFVYDEELELVKDHPYEAKGERDLHSQHHSAFTMAPFSVPYDYQNGTCGLCGNFNYRRDDDYRTPSGEILSSDLDFAKLLEDHK